MSEYQNPGRDVERGGVGGVAVFGLFMFLAMTMGNRARTASIITELGKATVGVVSAAVSPVTGQPQQRQCNGPSPKSRRFSQSCRGRHRPRFWSMSQQSMTTYARARKGVEQATRCNRPPLAGALEGLRAISSAAHQLSLCGASRPSSVCRWCCEEFPPRRSLH